MSAPPPPPLSPPPPPPPPAAQSGLLAELMAGRTALRHVDADDCRPCPQFSEVTADDVAARTRHLLQCNIENWVPLLGDEVTFPTVFVPVSREEARAMADNTSAPDFAEMRAAMEARLEAAMQQVKDDYGHLAECGRQVVFVRLSSRSAKDASIGSAKFRRAYRQVVREHGIDPHDDNGKLFALLEANGELLKMSNARDVMDAFLKSERVANDLLLALEQSDEEYQLNFVVRAWVTLHVDQEFRGFVNHGRLNALSQYNYMVHFPHVVAQRDELVRRMVVDAPACSPSLYFLSPENSVVTKKITQVLTTMVTGFWGAPCNVRHTHTRIEA